MTSIYFDHAATTPMRPEALRAYVEAAEAGPGNPSSVHAFGRSARVRITRARDELADVLGCLSSELVFTSGGTESDNAALLGAAHAQRLRGRDKIVTTSIEHHAVLNACNALADSGFEVVHLPVDGNGIVLLEAAEDAVDERTAVVSVMAGNNEVGSLQPIAAIGEIARSRQAIMHVDAVQAFGYIPLELANMPVDLLTLSAHKIGGPQGVGVLFIRKGTPFRPLLYGGSQERGRRAGTENVPGITAFAKAAVLAAEEREIRVSQTETLRKSFIGELLTQLGPEHYVLNGPEIAAHRLPHILNVSFPGISSETMLMNLDLAGIAASGGSACTSGSLKPSHVLIAMEQKPEIVASAVRFSFGMGNTTEETKETVKKIATISERMRIY